MMPEYQHRNGSSIAEILRACLTSAVLFQSLKLQPRPQPAHQNDNIIMEVLSGCFVVRTWLGSIPPKVPTPWRVFLGATKLTPNEKTCHPERLKPLQACGTVDAKDTT